MKQTEGIKYWEAFRESPGMAWGAFVQLYSQLTMIQGMVNTLMLLGVFYSTNLKGIWPDIPWWAYLVGLMVISLGLSVFLIMVGIPGIYKYGRRFMRTTQVEDKLDLIIKHLNIDTGELKNGN